MCLSRCVFVGPWFQMFGSGPLHLVRKIVIPVMTTGAESPLLTTYGSLCPVFVSISGPERCSSYFKAQLCLFHFCFTPYIIYHWINGRSWGRCLKARANVILIRSLPGLADFVAVWSMFPQYPFKPKFTRTGLNEPKEFPSLKQICNIHKPSIKLSNKFAFEGPVFPLEALRQDKLSCPNSEKPAIAQKRYLGQKPSKIQFFDLNLNSLLKVFINDYKNNQEQLMFKGLN